MFPVTLNFGKHRAQSIQLVMIKNAPFSGAGFTKTICQIAAIVVAIVAGASNLLGADLADYLEEFIGPQSRIIDEIKSASNAGDYDKVWDHLSKDYRSSLSKKLFLEQSRALQWKISKVTVGRIYAGKVLAYAPVRAVTLAKGREFRVDAVVFWKNEEGRWVLLNFPLLEPHFSEFGAIPEWLQ